MNTEILKLVNEFIGVKQDYEKSTFDVGLKFEELAIAAVNAWYGHERYVKNNASNHRAPDARQVYSGELVEIKTQKNAHQGRFYTYVIFNNSLGLPSKSKPDILSKDLSEIWYGNESYICRYDARKLQDFIQSKIERGEVEDYMSCLGWTGKAINVELKDIEHCLIGKIDIGGLYEE